jgi:large subunit ribosomal protein L18
MKSNLVKQWRQERRQRSVRARLRRSADVPRLSVARSSKHISAQVIDDAAGRTLAHATTTAKAIAAELAGKTKTERARVIGAEIARKAKEAGVKKVVFDRGASRYHGRVKALAEAAREAGLEF